VGSKVVDADSGLVSEPFLTARAFEHLYQEHRRKVYGYAARRIGPDLAEELTAQVFAEAWAFRARYDPDRGAPVVWLLGIATNLLRRYRRTEMTQLRAYSRIHVERSTPFDEAGILNAMAAADRWAKVASALVELPDADREILMLACWTNLSYADIAQVLDLSLGTVKSRLNRARARLVAHLGPTPTEGDDR
jgi:RNA polymerase sigma factor (sigma-70 family)